MTPNNEMLRTVNYRLAVYPYAGGRVEAGVALYAAQLLQPTYATVQSVDPNKFVGGRPFVQGAGMPDLFYREMLHPEIVIPLESNWVKLKSDVPGAMVISAWKGAECGEGKQIFRLFNTTSQNVSFPLTFTAKLKAAHIARLDETALGESVLKGTHTVVLSAKPKEIITLKLFM